MSGSNLKIQDLDDPSFDPFTGDEASWGDTLDPYPLIAEYRKKGSVHKLEYRRLFSDFSDRTFSSDIMTINSFTSGGTYSVLP